MASLGFTGYNRHGMNEGVIPNFRVLFEKTPGSYAVLDPHFFILAVTDCYVQTTRTHRADIVGQHFLDAFPDEACDGWAANIRASLERTLRDRVSDAMAVQKYCIRMPGGELDERHWSPSNTPILGRDGEVEYIIHSIEDVTEFVRRKMAAGEATPAKERSPSLETEILLRSEEVGAANEQLKAANEELALRTAELHDSLQTMQTFTYSIAHDLRAPLRALESFSSVVLEEHAAKLDDSGKDCLNRIRAAAHRMDLLVNDLLAYGQLTHVEVTAIPVSLENAVDKVLHDLRSELRARNAQVEVVKPLPTVVGNVVLLHQVLVNLFDNALKFVPEGQQPHIKIYSRQQDNRTQLCIHDNGIGIAPAYHARIFDLFARLHKPTEYTGTGIGLALVKKAMERMMGKVGVESNPGEGCCFWLEFRAGRQARKS